MARHHYPGDRYRGQGYWMQPRRPGPAGPQRASNEDRERVTGVLREATADGYLTLDEFGERVGAVLDARYLEDLDPLVADIPGAARPSTPAPAPLPLWQRVAFDHPVLRLGAVMLAGLVVVSLVVQLAFLGWPLFVFGFFCWKRGWCRPHHWGHRWGHGPGGRPAEFI